MGDWFCTRSCSKAASICRAIEKIVGDGNYTFVYIASVSAYMIPMNRYPEDEYGEFVAELREAWDDDTPKLAKRPVDEGIIEKSH